MSAAISGATGPAYRFAHAGYASLHSRHCERSEAIPNLSAAGFWIASSQELLAMTRLGLHRLHTLAVIAREGGRSSTPRHLWSIEKLRRTGFPAFAGNDT